MEVQSERWSENRIKHLKWICGERERTDKGNRILGQP